VRACPAAAAGFELGGLIGPYRVVVDGIPAGVVAEVGRDRMARTRPTSRVMFGGRNQSRSGV
jgi:hypothetical protein